MPEISTEQLLADRHATIEIVGKPKYGKTYAAISLLKHLEHSNGPKNLYLFDMDGDGAESVVAGLQDQKLDKWLDRLRIYRYTERLRMHAEATPLRESSSYMSFMNDLNRIVDMIDARTGTWRDPATAPGAIYMDPVTSISEIFWDYILTKKGKELGEGGQRQVTPQEWVILQEKIVEVIKVCKSLPCTRIFTFHEELIQEVVPGTISMIQGQQAIPPKATGQIFNLPLLSGKLQSSIGKWFSAIVYCRYQPNSDIRKRYKWVIRPSENERVTMAGSRSKQSLPDIIEQDFCTLLD